MALNFRARTAGVRRRPQPAGDGAVTGPARGVPRTEPAPIAGRALPDAGSAPAESGNAPAEPGNAPAEPGNAPTESGSAPSAGTRVPNVHRVGAVVVALVILVFGVLGFADGLAFFSTSGRPVLGMSSNGLLSTISVLTAVVLIVAAVMGSRIASTVMTVIGVLFLLSALANLALLRTDFNILAFEMSNVGFSVAAGLLLLVLGAYGRFSGNLPPDSPYAPAPATDDGPDPLLTPAESEAEHAMRAAEIAVVNRTATPEQRRRVAAMAEARTRRDRRRIWMDLDAQQ